MVCIVSRTTESPTTLIFTALCMLVRLPNSVVQRQYQFRQQAYPSPADNKPITLTINSCVLEQLKVLKCWVSIAHKIHRVVYCPPRSAPNVSV